MRALPRHQRHQPYDDVTPCHVPEFPAPLQASRGRAPARSISKVVDLPFLIEVARLGARRARGSNKFSSVQFGETTRDRCHQFTNNNSEPHLSHTPRTERATHATQSPCLHTTKCALSPPPGPSGPGLVTPLPGLTGAHCARRPYSPCARCSPPAWRGLSSSSRATRRASGDARRPVPREGSKARPVSTARTRQGPGKHQTSAR